MICPNCRQNFTAADASRVCAACSAYAGCHFVCCPHCGYEQPQQPKWVEKLAALFPQRSARGTGVPPVSGAHGQDARATMALNQLATGKSGLVKAIRRGGGHWRKFMALGIHPGVAVTVEQRFPALVIVIGHTRVAMDFEAAALVDVEPSDAS